MTSLVYPSTDVTMVSKKSKPVRIYLQDKGRGVEMIYDRVYKQRMKKMALFLSSDVFFKGR